MRRAAKANGRHDWRERGDHSLAAPPRGRRAYISGIIIAYTDRVNISVAAVAMREHFGWSQTQKGFVLAAFFVGYLLFMFVAGLLANRFGGERVVGYSVLAWSIYAADSGRRVARSPC